MSGPVQSPRPTHWRRITVAALIGFAILACPLPASGGYLWDLGAALGYVALIFALALYLYPLRGDGLPHKRLFTVSQHRRIGWIALSFAALHTVLVLITQPLTAHYLLPSAPLYMLCGTAALIVLGVLVATGISSRSTLRRGTPLNTTPKSVLTHALLAAVWLGLAAAHVLGSGQFVHTPTQIVTTCVLLAAPLLWAALRHRSTRLPVKLLSTVLPCFIIGVTVLILPAPTASSRLMQPALTPPLVHSAFPHEKHRTVNCVLCHHNYVDKTGPGSCLDCHRSARSDLRQAAEATFHIFCRDCHRNLAVTHEKHGPVRECSGCHTD